MDFINKFVDYLRSAKAELEKVTWPSRQDTIRYSTLVIGASLGLAIFFGVLDKSLVYSVEAIITSRPAPQAPAQPTTVPQIEPVEVEATTATPATAPIDLNASPLAPQP